MTLKVETGLWNRRETCFIETRTTSGQSVFKTEWRVITGAVDMKHRSGHAIFNSKTCTSFVMSVFPGFAKFLL